MKELMFFGQLPMETETVNVIPLTPSSLEQQMMAHLYQFGIII